MNQYENYLEMVDSVATIITEGIVVSPAQVQDWIRCTLKYHDTEEIEQLFPNIKTYDADLIAIFINERYQHVKTPSGREYQLSELRYAFSQVEDIRNWKLPIDTTIPKSELDITIDAITWYVGERPTIKDITNNSVRVVSRGYYLTN